MRITTPLLIKAIFAEIIMNQRLACSIPLFSVPLFFGSLALLSAQNTDTGSEASGSSIPTSGIESSAPTYLAIEVAPANDATIIDIGKSGQILWRRGALNDSVLWSDDWDNQQEDTDFSYWGLDLAQPVNFSLNMHMSDARDSSYSGSPFGYYYRYLSLFNDGKILFATRASATTPNSQTQCENVLKQISIENGQPVFTTYFSPGSYSSVGNIVDTESGIVYAMHQDLIYSHSTEPSDWLKIDSSGQESDVGSIYTKNLLTVSPDGSIAKFADELGNNIHWGDGPIFPTISTINNQGLQYSNGTVTFPESEATFSGLSGGFLGLTSDGAGDWRVLTGEGLWTRKADAEHPDEYHDTFDGPYAISENFSGQWVNFNFFRMNSSGMIAATATKVSDGLPYIVLLVPMKIEWNTIQGETAQENDEDNLEYFKVPSKYSAQLNHDVDWLEGYRYFPGKQASQGAINDRLKVKVTIPGGNGLKVKMKVLDVDDPSADGGDFDSSVVDSNGNNGADNISFDGDTLNRGQEANDGVGLFVLGTAQSAETTVTLDSDGVGERQFKIGMQPGNNYRIVGVIDGQAGNFSQLTTSGNPGDDLYVPPGNGSIIGFSEGVASSTLTVWRKLHIEMDTMDSIPTAEWHSEKNYQSLTIDSVTIVDPVLLETEPDGSHYVINGLAIVQFNEGFDPDDVDQYKSGKLVISGYDPFHIVASSSSEIRIMTTDFNHNTLDLDASGSSCKLYDDDDKGLAASGLGAALPFQYTKQAKVIDYMNAELAPAYIEAVHMNAHTSTAPFELHSDLYKANDDGKVITDSNDYWAAYVFYAYQIEEAFVAHSYVDGDPDNESGDILLGFTPMSGTPAGSAIANGQSTIYLETVRDSLGGITSNPEAYLQTVACTTLHEICHIPGGDNDTDHNEGGIMGDGTNNVNIDDLSGETVLRIRTIKKWDQQND